MLRRLLPLVVFLLTVIPAAAQRSAPTTAAPARAAADSTEVDAVVGLLQAKMSETLILNSIQNSGVVYKLTPADLLKLQKAGASDRIIEAMMATASPAKPASPAAPAPAATAAPATAPTPPSQPTTGKTEQPEKKAGGFLSRIGNRVKETATHTGESATATAEKAADTAVGSVDKRVDTAADTATDKVDDATSQVSGAGTKGDANRKGTKDDKPAPTSRATSSRK